MQISIADVVWGHMWGVGFEQKVVGTGLIGMDIDDEQPAAGHVVAVLDKGKGKAKIGSFGEGSSWKSEARQALSLVFEVR